MQLLLDAGADINSQTVHTEKWTPLGLALENGYSATAVLLKSRGARDNGVDYRRLYVMLILVLAVSCVFLQLPDTLEPVLRLSRVYRYITTQYPMIGWFLPGVRVIDAVRWWSSWWCSVAYYVFIELMYSRVLSGVTHVVSGFFRSPSRPRPKRFVRQMPQPRSK